ncbi:MAG: hypothetical protein ABIF71_14150 [Planctomycetota bacterium]
MKIGGAILIAILIVGAAIYIARPSARLSSGNHPISTPATGMHSSSEIGGASPAYPASETSPAPRQSGDPGPANQPPVNQPPIHIHHSPETPFGGKLQPAAAWGPAEDYNEAYYTKVDPGRIQQTRPLKEGEALPAIQIAGPGFQWVLPGKPCDNPLRVNVPTGMPCTFYAEDWGTFQNGKNCITVKADSTGIAEAFYTAPASKGGSMVLAHSPEAMGIARFSIKVVSEEELKNIRERKETADSFKP